MQDQVTGAAFAPGEAVDAARLSRVGLLLVGGGCVISPLAVFIPADTEGATRPVELGDGCHVGPFAVICGGARIGDGARLEEHVIVGRPEQGYAVGHVYPGAGAETVIGVGAVIRAGAIVYAGAEIGDETVVGHHTLLRSFVTVGSETQLGHNLTIERATRIGSMVRCSPGSHITSSCVLADRVFLGAGVHVRDGLAPGPGDAGRAGRQFCYAERCRIAVRRLGCRSPAPRPCPPPPHPGTIRPAAPAGASPARQSRLVRRTRTRPARRLRARSP